MTRRRNALSHAEGAPTALYLPVSFVVLGLVTFAALFLLMVGARSPYTHANLAAAYDPRYDRTAQITVGADESYGGISAPRAPTGDEVRDGEQLFVTRGCAACHTLSGRGGPVGPAIVGTDPETVEAKTRKGPGGMPRYAPDGLTPNEAASIAAYLRSLAQPTPSPGR